MEKSQNDHLPHLCWVLRGSGVLLSVGMLPGAGTLTPPVLTSGLKASGTAFMLWCCFCRWQGYFEVYGKANLPVCMFYISFVPEEVQRLAVNFQPALVHGSLGEKCSEMLAGEEHPI